MAIVWHLVTGEYPPECGGVGDYTAALAEALVCAGDTVHVWTPAEHVMRPTRGIMIHRLPDAFGRRSRDEMSAAWSAQPGVVLLQYVPHALGSRGGNLAFCRWFSRLGRRLPDVRVMVHEPYFYFTWSRPWAPANALAAVQRVMARLVLRGASRVYFSTETWTRYLSARGAVVLPIPSSIPAAVTGDDVTRARDIASNGDRAAALVGHFGTYGDHIGGELMSILPLVVERAPAIRIALVGAGGPAFVERLSAARPDAARRVWASGRLDPPAVAAALRACDLLLQPYPDGVTTRRTSIMAGLRNGVPIVTTRGALTERVWDETGAVAFAPAGDAPAFAGTVEQLLRDRAALAALGARGAAAYAGRFSMEHTIATLRGPAAA